jgi:hypothetical protein
MGDVSPRNGAGRDRSSKFDETIATEVNVRKKATRSPLANFFRFRITKQTLPTKKSLCAAAVSGIVRFVRHKRTWDASLHLVAL